MYVFLHSMPPGAMLCMFFIDSCLFLCCQEGLVGLRQEVLSALFTEDLLFCGVMGKLRAMLSEIYLKSKLTNAWAL